MRYGYWLPVFGGWLRNVENEKMQTSWAYVKKLAQRSEQIGFDLTLIAELNLNDIKGVEAPSLDAWSTSAALAAVTERIELMVAVRPTFHLPALLAKQAANIDHISRGRLSLNVVSSWWADEARQYGVPFEQHDDRYARTAEWLEVLDGVWSQDNYSFTGKYYRVEETILQPKPASRPRPTIYAGGESPAAKELIAARCVPDAWRSPRKNPRKNRRPFGATRAAGLAADEIRRGRVRHLARHRERGAGRARPHHRRQAERRWISKLPAMAGRHTARAERVARGLLGF